MEKQSAELLFTGGTIITNNQDNPVAEAIAISGGKVVAAGGDRDVAAAVNAGREIALGGKTILPGLIDSHLHLNNTGRMGGDIEVFGIHSIGELCERMSNAIESRGSLRSGGLIAARSDCLHPRHLSEGRLPTCNDLDEICADKPLAITDVNKTIVNSLVLRDIDISDISSGGEVGRFEDGSPNGIFMYAAKMMTPLGAQSAASSSNIPVIEAIDRAQDAILASGVSGVVAASVTPDDLAALQTLHAEGRLKIRTRCFLAARDFKTLDNIRRAIDRAGDGDEMLSIEGVKLFYDKFFMHRTALFDEPYLNAPGIAGSCFRSRDELYRWVYDCSKAGLATCTHSTGTRGTDDLIGVYEQVAEEVGLVQPSHFIHVYFPGEGAIERIEKLGVGVALQPSFIRPWGETAIDLLGSERASRFTPCRSYLDAGVVVGGGSDSPITHYDPFNGMANAAGRVTDAGEVLGPDERITAEEALAIYTTGAAGITGEAEHRGRLMPGMTADMTVCSEDIFACQPDDIRHIKAEMTIVDGRIMYPVE